MGDEKSTSNMQWHAKICWGKEVVVVASQTKDIYAA
jgi:hypothetical protein